MMERWKEEEEGRWLGGLPGYWMKEEEVKREGDREMMRVRVRLWEKVFAAHCYVMDLEYQGRKVGQCDGYLIT